MSLEQNNIQDNSEVAERCVNIIKETYRKGLISGSNLAFTIIRNVAEQKNKTEAERLNAIRDACVSLYIDEEANNEKEQTQ